jgi:hypothetical protein
MISRAQMLSDAMQIGKKKMTQKKTYLGQLQSLRRVHSDAERGMPGYLDYRG